MHRLLHLSAEACLTCCLHVLTPPRGLRLPSASPQLLSAGKFYVLQTGCNEKRWPKMKENLTTVVKSFQVEDRSVRLALQLLTLLQLAAVLDGSVHNMPTSLGSAFMCCFPLTVCCWKRSPRLTNMSHAGMGQPRGTASGQIYQKLMTILFKVSRLWLDVDKMQAL